MTRSEMAECLGCSDSTVKRALRSMVEKGVIKRIGSNKKDEWIILNVNDDDSGKSDFCDTNLQHFLGTLIAETWRLQTLYWM